jgi:hypothetical protein
MKRRKTQRSLARSFVITVAVGLPTALLAGTGCSSGEPASPAGPGTPPQGPGVLTGACSNEGAQRPCHFSLGKTGSGKVLSCFDGTQTCTGGLWGLCGGEGTVTNSVVDLSLAPASSGAVTGGIHTLGGGGCGDGICAGALCNGGSKNGQLCKLAADCPGGVCLTKACDKGANKNKLCVLPADCPGGACVAQGEDCTTCPSDCGVCPPGAPSATVAICTTDPCNPDCKGWSTPAGISSSSGSGVGVVGVSGFGQIANGQIKKLLLDSCNTGSSCDNFGAAGLPSSYYNCQVDTSCSMTSLGGDGCCHQFPPNGIQGTLLDHMGVNPGVDITIGPGCSDKEFDKYRYFPICNRGTLPVAPGTVIRVKYFNPVTSLSPCSDSSCTSTSGYDCSMKTDAVLGLPPGVCQLLDTQCPSCAPGGGACSQPNGDKWIYANCDGATTGVAEGTMTMKPGAAPTGVTGAPDNEPTTAPGILGCANNWTDHSPNNNPPACTQQGQNVVSFSSDYHATCPPSTGVVWNKLIYDTSTPKNASGTSEVFFEAATAPDVSGTPGTFSTFYEIAEAQANNAGNAYVIAGATLGADPEKCSATQPAVPPYGWATCTSPGTPCCPKDIETQLTRSPTATPFNGAGPVPGGLLARNPWLRLKITIKATPDAKLDATLNSWSISYQCIARE